MDKLFVRKDVYDEIIEKGFGKRDYSKLTKKKITDKNGHTRTVYVRNGEQPAEVKQPKAQEGLTPEKKTRYEEMLEKVVAGPEDNALFVRGKGMLNKKEAIAHLSEKLGKHADAAIKNANDKAAKLVSMSKDDKIAILSEYMHKKYSSVSVEDWKKTYNAKLSDKELDEAFKDFSETHQNTIKEYQKKKPVSSAAQGHLEADEPLNTDITAEDEKRFGKEALSGLSGKRTSGNVAQKMANAEDKAFSESEKDAQKKYGNMSIEELKAEAKKYDGVSKYSPEANEARKVYDILNQKLEEEKKNNSTKTKNKTSENTKAAENKKEIDRLMKIGFDRRSAYAKVALDAITDRLDVEKDKSIREKLFEDMRDVQLNGLNAKYFETHKDEYGF